MKLSREVLPLPRAVAPDEEIAAIGDIHGRADLLEALLAQLRRDAAEAPSANRVPRRSRRSRPRFARRARTRRDRGGRATSARRRPIALFGNHEILMRLALDPATPQDRALAALQIWLGNGGGAVVEQLLGPTRLGRAAAARRAGRGDAGGGARLAARPAAACAQRRRAVRPRRGQSEHAAGELSGARRGTNRSTGWRSGPIGPGCAGPSSTTSPDADGFSGYFVVHGHTPLDRGHTQRPRRAGCALPAQSRRRLGDDGAGENGDPARRCGGGRHRAGVRAGFSSCSCRGPSWARSRRDGRARSSRPARSRPALLGHRAGNRRGWRLRASPRRPRPSRGPS